MLPNRILRHALHRGLYTLFPVMLLSISAAGQSLTSGALRDIKTQLATTIADTTRVRLLLILSSHATAHVDRITARDSALQFARTAHALSAKIHYDSGIYRSYLHEIRVWVEVNNGKYWLGEIDTVALRNARAAQSKFIVFVRSRGSIDQLGAAYSEVATLHLNGGYAVESVGLYDSAQVCYRTSANALQESHALYGLGLSYNQLGKLKESLPIYHRSIKLAEPTGGPHLYCLYGILGRTYNNLGGYSIALKYQMKAMQLAEAAKDTTDEMGAIHLFLGMTYSKLRKYALAREHFEKAYHIDRHYTAHHANEFFAAATNLADAISIKNPQDAIDFLIRLKEEYKALMTPGRTRNIDFGLMSAYIRKRDYITGQLYCNKLIAIPETVPGALYRSEAIGQFLVVSGQYRTAEKYLANAAQIAKTEGRMYNLQNIYLLWHKVDSAKRDYAAALEKFKLHKAYGDSTLNESKEKEIALLEIEYETAKKEQSIALLTKDSELSQQQLAQSKFQQNGSLAALAVAVLISGLVVNQYRIKKKNNTELTQRQQEIQSMNTVLQRTIIEKEWLLKEVNHRVKNNLQTVVSLLETQSYSVQGSEAASAIRDSQNRVHAMSLIHQKLNLTEHRTSINMSAYLSELTEYLRDSFSTGRLIDFQLFVQAIVLDVSQAIPIGLILNEAVTNAIKYAFPTESKENCQVIISMKQDKDQKVSLTIADNGCGLPPDFDPRGKHFGMGLNLLHGLTTDLDGRCTIGTHNGTGVLIEVVFNANVLNFIGHR
ncbi:histidine kinase dimerization/phosphoacceptor domain -containing protein [Chryseolinea lacunae]|uniref:histidine kinase n=1 Tax=Chryseolinea lacunae TaxID=2801331 RepID=A0ABS1L298_9BACT|nr:histidine kinase dimerization/phosphoacceptor domain -containing protein [Chryseolinea lacunae]MBL0745809.1 tetratricopeptide repeat protein [Chryseolinea lacunae]